MLVKYEIKERKKERKTNKIWKSDIYGLFSDVIIVNKNKIYLISFARFLIRLMYRENDYFRK